jgi:hypothetical protein
VTIDAEAIAAQLEGIAQAEGLGELSTAVHFTTAEGNPAMALVSVTVTDPGIISEDDTASTPANTPVNIPVLANDVDQVTGDNSTLIVASVTQPPAGQGTVAIAADQKSVIFTPAQGFVGTTQFSYTAARAA